MESLCKTHKVVWANAQKMIPLDMLQKCWLNGIMTQFVIISTKRRILWTMSTEKKPIRKILEGLLTKWRELLLYGETISFPADDDVEMIESILAISRKRWNFFQSFFYSLTASKLLYFMPYPKPYTMLVGSIQCMLPITSLDCPFIRAHCFTRWRLKGVKKLIFCRRYKMHCGLIFLLLWVPY